MNGCDAGSPLVEVVFRPDRDLMLQVYGLRPRAWRARSASFPNIAAWTDAFDESSDHWVVIADGRVIAAARLTIRDTVEDLPHPELYRALSTDAAAPVASINRLVVDVAHAGKGLSRRLDEARLSFADSVGVSMTLATTFAGQRRVENLKSLGFEEQGFAARYVDGPLTQVNAALGAGRLLSRRAFPTFRPQRDDVRKG